MCQREDAGPRLQQPIWIHISNPDDDVQVTAALGDGVGIMPGMDSQSTSTSIVNGRRTQMTSIGFLIAGRRGRTAQAEVSAHSCLHLVRRTLLQLTAPRAASRLV